MKLHQLKEGQFLTDKGDILYWLGRNTTHQTIISPQPITIDDISIDQNGFVDVRNTVNLRGVDIGPQLPIKFGKVDGNFVISRTPLQTLEGCPHTVGKNFICSNTNIKSFVGGPRIVGETYEAVDTNITTIEGLPEQAEHINLGHTRITNLRNIHKMVKRCSCISLTSCDDLNSHILGVMLIKGLKRVFYISHTNTTTVKAFNIINDCLFYKQDVHTAQERLLEAGYPEHAKL